MTKKNQSQSNTHSGFTLVELIVVVGIIAVISALSLFNSSKLNSAVLISNTAYEIGLIIRDAQVSGLGAKVMQTSDNGIITATTSNQGVFFDSSSPANEKIIFFADLNKNNKYDEFLNEQSQVYSIENKRAGKIIKICEVKNDNTCTQIEDLTVIFKRPNPEAYFYDVNYPDQMGYSGMVAINVGFEGGDCRTISIYKTGAIQIDRSQCSAVTN